MSFIKKIVMAGVLLFGLSPVAHAAPLVDVAWLSKNLENSKVVVIDLRNKIDGGNYDTFVAGHIPGSQHSDYLKAGWRVERDGVVGLLPTADQFQKLARDLGVNADSHVVIVPAGNGATDFGSAARAYWTFKVFGHDDVSILDGGYKAWADNFDGQIATGAPQSRDTGDFVAIFRSDAYVSQKDVQARVKAGEGAVLLDARPQTQFLGQAKHPKAREVGRIPGATSFPQTEAYAAAVERLRSTEELEKLYADYADKPIISYCNTGHWAATNWFVLSELLGHKNVKMYDGSMVEWTANADNPLAVGESNLDKLKGFFSKITS